MPSDSAYEYNPKPPQADPPISRHEFEMAFASCDSPCGSPCLLAPFHDCVEPMWGNEVLNAIPKRKTALEIKKIGREEIWGIQAQYRPSIVYAVLYHLLIIAGTFGIWGWWLSRHPYDLQSAAVPVTLALGLFSLFWSLFAILKSPREPF